MYVNFLKKPVGLNIEPETRIELGEALLSVCVCNCVM